MKRLKEYIFEQLDNIFESNFENKSWSHNGKYDYPQRVIKVLLKMIGIDNEESVEKITINEKPISISKNQNLINELNDLLENVKYKSPKDLNNIFSKYNIGIDNKIASWTNIDKHPFTTGSKSQSYSEGAEYLVTYLFNLGYDKLTHIKLDKEYYGKNGNIDNILNDISNNKDIIKSIKEWEDLNGRNSISSKESPYLLSSIKSALLCYKLLENMNLNRENYYAIQVNGTQLSKDAGNGNSLLLNAAKCFSDSETINFLCKNKANAKTLFGGSNKDGWNKADILLVQKNYNIINDIQNQFSNNETIKKFNAKEISDQNINIEKEYLNIFNSIINNIINEYKVIPISLKLIPFSSNGSLEKEGKLDSEEQGVTKIEDLNDEDNVAIILPKSVEPNTVMASVYLKANHKLESNEEVTYVLHFRTQSGERGVNNLTIQSSIDYIDNNGNKQTMRMGKGIAAVKKQILNNTKDNSYYKEITSNEELATLLSKTFKFYNIATTNLGNDATQIVNTKNNEIDRDSLLNKIQSIKTQKDENGKGVDLYERTPFKGLFGILDAIITNKKIDNMNKLDLNRTFSFLYKLCALNENEFKSQWWLIM